MAGKTKKPVKVKEYDGTLDRKRKTCPQCGETKAISKIGVRLINDVWKPQSWCIECRRNGGPVKPKRKDKIGKIKPKAVKPKAVKPKKTESKSHTISTDKAATKKLYNEIFPNDKASRGWYVMAQRLEFKLGTASMTPEAAASLRKWELKKTDIGI